jgi:methionine sulfoxide reductase catalytic subunit
MLIKRAHPHPIRPSEITSESVYAARRRFLWQAGIGLAGVALPACGRTGGTALASGASSAAGASGTDAAASATAVGGAELQIAKKTDMAAGEALTSYQDVTHYNNYYEFGVDKRDPAEHADTLRTRPWTVVVDGECEAPGKIDIDDLIKPHALEERIYRHRCVEAWSIVVPWVGFALADLLARFKPTSKAKYVAFATLFDREQMPRARNVLDWPYREGLRIDEAMHPLAFMSVGLYGHVLPNQDGAPLRLTIPWKYGFKSIKSIVRISFVEAQPLATWNHENPQEYGFYSNVNPNVSHPRRSQARERRLGELFKRDTLMFNGYPEVASLYAGMDLRKYI